MANRAALKPYLGQQNAPVQVAASFLGQGAAAPLNNVGDPGALWLTITRQNVGKYTLKTVDPWVAIHGFDAALGVATIATSWSCTFGIPSQNTDGTWSVTLQTFATGALADVILNDILSVALILSNSVLTP